MKKRNITIFGILIILSIITYVYINYSPTEKAFIHIINPEVEIYDGTVWKKAVENMPLEENYKVKTNANGRAALFFYESIIIDLDVNTETIIKSVNEKGINIVQNSGSTWNKFFTKGSTWNKFFSIIGINSFQVETPTAVAVVRGTSFEVSENKILVGTGELEINVKGNKFNLKKGEKLIKKENIFVKEQLTKEDLDIIFSRSKDTLERMKFLRNKELKEQMEKLNFLTKRILNQYQKSEGDVWVFVDDVDNNKHNVDELLNKLPFETKPIKKIASMTKEIQERQKELNQK